MRCPFCNSPDTQVKDSRVADDGSYIKRRRICGECGSRFTTFERIQLKEIYVRKSNDAIVPFEREKLYRSIAVACKKRPVEPERIEKIVLAIQRQLESTGEQEISSREIGLLAMEMLSRVDMVAYIRFASVYCNFEAREDFLKFIDAIKKDVETEREVEVDPGEETSRAAKLDRPYDKCKLSPRKPQKDSLF
jgi:transcriptional repressor NrdR